MPTVTYRGPADQLKVGDTVLKRNTPIDVPKQIADKAVKKAGDRVTVADDKPAAGGGKDDA